MSYHSVHTAMISVNNHLSFLTFSKKILFFFNLMRTIIKHFQHQLLDTSNPTKITWLKTAMAWTFLVTFKHNRHSETLAPPDQINDHNSLPALTQKSLLNSAYKRTSLVLLSYPQIRCKQHCHGSELNDKRTNNINKSSQIHNQLLNFNSQRLKY